MPRLQCAVQILPTKTSLQSMRYVSYVYIMSAISLIVYNAGQIFCAKCTSDIVNGETLGHFGKVRVCKFCYSNLQPSAKTTVAGPLAHQERGDLSNNDDACTGGAPLHATTRPQTPRLHFSTPTTRNSYDDDYMIANIRRSSAEFDGHQPPTPSPSLSMYQREDQDAGGHKKGFLPKRPRSRTITMNSIMMDNTPLPSDLVRSSIKPTLPFRRNSLNSTTLDGGGLPLSGITPLTDAKDNPTTWKWDKVPQSLSSLMEGRNSVEIEGDINDQPKAKDGRLEDIKTSGSSSDHSSKRDSLTGRPARKRTYSLMKNASVAALDTMAMTRVQKNDSENTSSNGYRRHRRQSSTCTGMELDLMSMDYMRKMLNQMLQECPDEVKDNIGEWESTITKLLLKMVDRVRQDVRGGDEIDIRHYVKIKKIAGGNPKDSFYVQGVVCTKNVAHKQMVRKIRNPRILIIKFPLEWSRDYQGDQQLQSIKRVMEQEKDFLKKLVNRIIALKPSVLLVLSHVSRIALDFLVKNDIVVAYNVKPSILDAVARCTGANIISSLADLNTDESVLGFCGVFEPKTILHDMLPNRRKTFLIFRDCPADLGATIILRGGSIDALQAVKKVLDFMVFVVHNLRLETIFHKDVAKTLSSCITQREPGKEAPAAGKQTDCSVLLEDGEEGLVAIQQVIHRYQNALLSASPRVMIPLPHLLSRLCETEKSLVKVLKDHGLSLSSVYSKEASPPNELSQMPEYFQAFEHDLTNESEYSRLLEEHHHRWRAFETYVGSDAEELNPSYHQQLVVLYATVCCETAVPCHDPELRMFEYYRPDSDVTLGQYVEDVTTYSNMICTSVMCERTMMEHYRTYAHGNAQICVSLERIEAPPAVMNADAVLMWSYCKECDADSILVPLSEDGWKYSFGKFLEVVFHHRGGPPAQDAWCPHSIYRNHTLYFAYKGIAVKFEYTPIVPYDILAPATRLHIDPSVQVNIKDAASDSLRSKIVQFYESIIERNKSFQLDTVHPTKREQCKLHLEDLSHRANSEKKQMLQFLQNVYATTPPTDTLSLNIVRIKMQMHVLQWKLVYAQFVRQYVVQINRRKKHQQLDNTPMETADLDARTKRLTNSADLPLLDVGIDGYDEFFCGGSQENTKDEKFLAMPVLGTSPSSSSSSQRIRDTETSGSSNDPDIQNRIEDESSSSESDSSSAEEEDTRAARRLSLELLQKKSKRASLSMSRLPRPHDIDRREGKQQEDRCQQQQQQRDYRRNKRLSYPAGAKSERMPLPMSSRDYKRLADLLPSLDSGDISKSRSSPPLVSRLLRSYQSGQPASNSNEIRNKLSSLESQIVNTSPLQHQQQQQQQKQLARKQPAKDRKTPAEYKTKIPVRSIQHPLKQQQQRDHTRSDEPSNNKTTAKDDHRKIRFAPKVENHGERRVRGVRQRLPSKASIEVYTTLRELVHEDSEDEFSASESDLSSSDDDDEEEGQKDGEEKQQQEEHNMFFSMMDTDEFDESLGRELSPKLRRHHSDILQRRTSANAVPHLDFDGYNDLEKSHESKEEKDASVKDTQNLTVSDFRSFAEKNGLNNRDNNNPFENIGEI